MTDRQFWWATVHGNDVPEVVEVNFEDGKPHRVYLSGTDVDIEPYELDECVRLIERVLPAGRVTAAGLRDALVASGWHDTGYVSALQGCQVTDDLGEPTGKANTLLDGYFDLAKAAAILQGGEASDALR